MTTTNNQIPRVIVETPYSGDIELNVEYALSCLNDSYVNHKEAPFMSHLLYTRFPSKETENVYSYQGHVEDSEDSRLGRVHGIGCGMVWGDCADKVIVYTDIGISSGMKYGIKYAKKITKKLFIGLWVAIGRSDNNNEKNLNNCLLCCIEKMTNVS